MQQRMDTIELTPEGEIKPVKRDYRRIADTVGGILRREGVSGFFKGIIPNAIRVAPNAAITFVVYEAVMDSLQG